MMKAPSYVRFWWAMGVLACMAISVTISVSLSNRAVREAERNRIAASEQGRAVSCAFIVSLIRAYNEDPPESQTGKNVLDAWIHLADTFGCPKQ